MQNVTITLFDKEGAILQYKEHTRRAESPKEATKNGRAIESLVNALKRLKKPCNVTIITDSAYLYGPIMNSWAQKWADSEWKNAKGQEVANTEHWKAYLNVIQGHKITVALEGRKNGKGKEEKQ